MRWTVALAFCGALAACGGAKAPPAPRTTLRFAEPPLVFAIRGGGVSVWVRTNRPLRDNEGALHEYRGTEAALEIPGTRPDIPGMSRDIEHPTCYGQYLDGDLANGERVRVALALSPGRQVTATVRAQRAAPTAHLDAEALRRLHCPTDGGATRRCGGKVSARYVGVIGLDSATNAPCRTARAVMRSAGRWADDRCFHTLCVRGHRDNRGFRCSVDLVGEADWQITCVRGRAIVRGQTAE
jgi:hypothetical protein